MKYLLFFYLGEQRMKNEHVRKLIILLMVTLLCSVFLLSCNVIDDNTNTTFKVSEISPPDEAINVTQSITISVTFSADIDKTTATEETILITDSKGNSVAGKISSYGISVSFTPTAKLTKLTTYTVIIKSQLKDSQGRTLGSDYSSSFTTGDDSA
jgi:hypothetical protein